MLGVHGEEIVPKRSVGSAAVIKERSRARPFRRRGVSSPKSSELLRRDALVVVRVDLREARPPRARPEQGPHPRGLVEPARAQIGALRRLNRSANIVISF